MLRTRKIELMLEELTSSEERKAAAVKDIMRRIFYNFDKRSANNCVCLH